MMFFQVIIKFTCSGIFAFTEWTGKHVGGIKWERGKNEIKKSDICIDPGYSLVSDHNRNMVVIDGGDHETKEELDTKQTILIVASNTLPQCRESLSLLSLASK